MDYIISLSGLLLGISPWVFRYSDNQVALWTSVILGAVAFLVAGYRALTKDTHKWEEWTAGLAGLLAIVLPLVLGFSAPAIACGVVLGIIVVALAAFQVFSGRAPGPVTRAT